MIVLAVEKMENDKICKYCAQILCKYLCTADHPEVPFLVIFFMFTINHFVAAHLFKLRKMLFEQPWLYHAFCLVGLCTVLYFSHFLL